MNDVQVIDKKAEILTDNTIQSIIDKVNSLYGRGTVFCAAEGTQQKWRMKQQNYYGQF